MSGDRIAFVMPQLGETVATGVVARWLVSEGDDLVAGEAALEISTDKVDSEVPVTIDAVVGEIVVPEGEEAEVGAVLAWLVPIGTASTSSIQLPDSATIMTSSPPVETAPFPVSTRGKGGVASTVAAPPSTPYPDPVLWSGPSVSAAGVASSQARALQPQAGLLSQTGLLPQIGSLSQAVPLPQVPLLSPVVRRLAAEHKIVPASLEGTGRNGRVTKRDIERVILGRATPDPAIVEQTVEQATVEQAALERHNGVAPTDAGLSFSATQGSSPQLVASSTVADMPRSGGIATATITANVSAIDHARTGVLGRTPFLVASVARALRQFPSIAGDPEPTISVGGRHCVGAANLRVAALNAALDAARNTGHDGAADVSPLSEARPRVVAVWDFSETGSVVVTPATDPTSRITLSLQPAEAKVVASLEKDASSMRVVHGSTLIATYRTDLDHQVVAAFLTRIADLMENLDWPSEAAS